MGLEVVQLILRVEEEFGVELADKECEQISTCGELCALLESKLALPQTAAREFCPTQRAFYGVRRELLALSSCEKRQIRPQTPISQILPRRNRREAWAQLESRLGTSLPPLQIHDFWLFPAGVIGFCTFFFPILLLSDSEWNVAISIFAGGAFTLWLGAILTRPLAVYPAPNASSVAQLSRRFAGMTPVQSEREIWPRLREVIADELSVPLEKVRRDADFYRDLGAV